MCKVFEDSRKTFARLQARVRELAGDDGPTARDVARAVAAELRRQARVPEEKLHYRVTI